LPKRITFVMDGDRPTNLGTYTLAEKINEIIDYLKEIK